MKTHSEQAIMIIAKEIKDWKFINNGLERSFTFLNFSQALGFIIQVGLLAEKNNHHPEIFNVYTKVKIRLTTHDAGGVTDNDISMAKSINEVY